MSSQLFRCHADYEVIPPEIWEFGETDCCGVLLRQFFFWSVESFELLFAVKNEGWRWLLFAFRMKQRVKRSQNRRWY